MSSDTVDHVPDSVTFREVRELLRTFRDSGWRGMTLDLHGMRITVGKDGTPPSAVAGGGGQAVSATVAEAPATTPETDVGRVTTAAPAAPAAEAATSQPAGPAPGSGTGAVDTTGCVAVRSPAVGAFWVAPSPGRPPFVEVGQTVAVDEQLAIVEVMKLMNPVVATTSGEVVQICAVDADMVEYEQVLFWIRPTDE